MTHTTLYRWSVALLLSLCALLLSAAPQSAHAQSTDVAITGTITDSKGGVLPNAVINVKNETTANIRSIKVDAQGHFSLSGLTPGRYIVEVSAAGFDLNRRTVQLIAGQDQDISVAMNIGGVSQQVTVQANPGVDRRRACSDGRIAGRHLGAHLYQSYFCPEFHFSCGRLR